MLMYMSEPAPVSFNERRKFKYKLRQFFGIPIDKRQGGNSSKPAKVVAGVGGSLLLLLLVIGGTYLYVHNHKSKPVPKITASAPVTPRQVEKLNTNAYNKLLGTQDYETFQGLQQSLAMQYYTNNDFAGADRVMSDVVDKVPSNNVNGSSYSMLAQIARAEKNTDKFKYYAKLAITKLRTEDRGAEADNLQKLLDSVN